MSHRDLLDRLRDLDPVRTGASHPPAVDDGSELAAILAHPVERPGGGRLRRSLRRHSARTVALLLALLVVGGGVAYAVGVPDDVRRVFSGIAAQPTPVGAPVPWGDNPASLVASLPMGDGRTVQQWESDNDLNGTCTYTRVLDTGGVPKDVGHGCQGAYPSGAPAGVRPTRNPLVHFIYQAVDVTPLQPDLPASPDPDAIVDVPTWYLMEIYAPEISSIQLVAPGHPPVPATIRGHWAVVRSPVTSGQEDPSTATVLRLRDAGGGVRWTYDLDTGTTTPCSTYRAFGVSEPCRFGTGTVAGSETFYPDDGSSRIATPRR